MTKELLRLPATKKFKSYEEDEELYIEGYASTNDVDRDWEVIPSSAVDLENFKKNPIILYQHDRMDPVGKAVAIERRDTGIWLKVLISKTAEKVRQMIKEGILTTFSCGFRIKDYDIKDDGLLIYKDIEFTETSIVSVPCNTEAQFALCKSYNENLIKDENNLIKGVKEPKPIKKETNIMTPEEIKALELKVAKMKAEKEALEAEKAASLLKAKEDIEAAEKAALNDTIKTLTETIAAVTESVETFKTEAAEKEAVLLEEIETIKKAAPKVEGIEPVDVLKDFSADFKDVAIESMLMGKDWKDTEKFGSLPERVKAVTLSSTFTTQVKDQILTDIKEAAPISQLFTQLPSNITTDIYPFGPDVPANWGTTASDQAWEPGQVSIAYKSIFSSTKYNYVTDEETIIGWLPFLRNRLVTAIGEGIDTAIVNRTTVTNSFYSLPVWAFTYSDAVNTYALADELDITSGDIAGMRAKMVKYGVNPSNLALFLNSSKYLQILNDSNTITVDKFGANATIKTGQLASIWGIPIFINDSAPGESAVGVTKVGATLVNTKSWGVKVKSFMTEFEKAITSQDQTIVSSCRCGFGPLNLLDGSSKINVPSVMCGYNPSS